MKRGLPWKTTACRLFALDAGSPSMMNSTILWLLTLLAAMDNLTIDIALYTLT